MIDMILEFLPAALITFGVMFLLMPVALFLVRVIGLYTIVFERTCHVYVLFGKVVGTIEEPGLHILPFRLGLSAFLVNWLGQRHVLDMRLDQEYLRSQPVNSEEGAPMGIGMWYEMYISDPVAFLFKNTDPRGSLRANVSNATVRAQWLLFWCREPDEKLTWVFPRHHRLLLLREARTAKSVIRGIPPAHPMYREVAGWRSSTTTAAGSTFTRRPWWRAWSCLDPRGRAGRAPAPGSRCRCCCPSRAAGSHGRSRLSPATQASKPGAET